MGSQVWCSKTQHPLWEREKASLFSASIGMNFSICILLSLLLQSIILLLRFWNWISFPFSWNSFLNCLLWMLLDGVWNEPRTRKWCLHIEKKKKKAFAHLNYCNEVLIDLGRKEGPTETALWNTLQVQLSQEGVGKEDKYGVKKINMV